MDEEASPEEVVLWKDIWWIRSLHFLLMVSLLFWGYEVLIRKLRQIVRNDDVGSEWELEENLGGLDSYPEKCKEKVKMSGNSEELVVPGEEKMAQSDSILASGSPPSNDKQEKSVQVSGGGEGGSAERKSLGGDSSFHDLYHHGINFYEDDMLSFCSSKSPRPRMHSTVTESIIKNRAAFRPTPATPSFPAASISHLHSHDLWSNFATAASVPRFSASNPSQNSSSVSETESLKLFRERVKSNLENLPSSTATGPPPLPPRMSPPAQAQNTSDSNEEDHGKTGSGVDKCCNRDLVCSVCHSKIRCCCACTECTGKDLGKQANSRLDDKSSPIQEGHQGIFIDDDFEDMENISMNSDEVLESMTDLL